MLILAQEMYLVLLTNVFIPRFLFLLLKGYKWEGKKQKDSWFCKLSCFVDEIKYIDETTDDDDIDNKEGERLLAQATSDDVEQNGDVPETIDESSPMLTEIQSEMENKQDQPTETDALMEKSWKDVTVL